jgi:hypothetical protein
LDGDHRHEVRIQQLKPQFDIRCGKYELVICQHVDHEAVEVSHIKQNVKMFAAHQVHREIRKNDQHSTDGASNYDDVPDVPLDFEKIQLIFERLVLKVFEHKCRSP